MSNWIQSRRKQLGLSQDQFAAQLQLKGQNVSRGMVSHWEIGKYPPPLNDPEFVNAFADVLKLSVVEVLNRAGFNFSSDGTSEAAKRAALIVDQLPPSRQKLALGILERFLEDD